MSAPDEPEPPGEPDLRPSRVVPANDDVGLGGERSAERLEGGAEGGLEALFGDVKTDGEEGPPSEERPSTSSVADAERRDVARGHLRGLIEALVFVSDQPIKASQLAKAAAAPLHEVKELLAELRDERQRCGVQLEELASGWAFRTNPAFAPFVRDLTGQKPVKLTRAQIETLAILAYRQPITRPEIDDIRGVDSGPVLKLLLERELIRILGKKDEPGRPILYGTTGAFLEFFGLHSLKDLPTLREFTELTDDSRKVVEKELGEVLPAEALEAALAAKEERESRARPPAEAPAFEPQRDNPSKAAESTESAGADDPARGGAKAEAADEDAEDDDEEDEEEDDDDEDEDEEDEEDDDE